MKLFFSGDNQRRNLAAEVVEWYAKEHQLPDIEIEVNCTDLSEDYAVGFCSHNEDNEFLIELHNDLTKRDFIVTLLHELVHVSQDLCGLTDTEERESAAEQQEVILFRQFQNTY